MRTRYRSIIIAVALVALASMAALASAASAAKPAPPYEDFAGCPSEAEQPFVGDCLKLDFFSGHIGFGNREISVTNPIIMRGGLEQETGNFLYNSEGGIVPVQQTVPGGLVGLTGYKWLDEALGKSNLLKLYATVELAGQPGSFNEPAFTVPVRLHLENPFLGNSCFVGSTAHPITLNLLTENETGALEPEAGRPKVLVSSSPGTLFDSTYSVPAATGCEFNFGPVHTPINDLINSRYALPSASGTDSTVLNYHLAITFPDVIYP
jgi:hypothetical protein